MGRKNGILIRNTNIYFEIYGRGMPILIIHGWGIDHTAMSGSMETIFKGNNRHFQRIYVDLPGMGKSDVNKDVKTADDVLSILIDFIDKVIPKKNFLIVGGSWGGSLVRALLHYKLDDILGICLLCTTSLSNEKNISIPRHSIIEKDNDLLDSLSLEEKKIFSSISVVQTRKVWRIFKRDVYPAIIKRDMEYLTKILNPDFVNAADSHMPMFNKPVLIISGKQDAKVGYQDQAEMFMNYPRATVAVLDKSGHCLQIEQEKLFKALVSDWLDRVKTYTE